MIYNLKDFFMVFTNIFCRRGQLEIINGGWCMADEATPSLEGLLANYEVSAFLSKT